MNIAAELVREELDRILDRLVIRKEQQQIHLSLLARNSKDAGVASAYFAQTASALKGLTDRHAKYR